jgi:hypothetical protein
MVLPLTMASTATTGVSASGVTVKVAVPSLPARFAQHPGSRADRDGGGHVGVAAEGIVFVEGVGVALGGRAAWIGRKKAPKSVLLALGSLYQ